MRIEIFRQANPLKWDLYADNHFVERFDRLCDAKRRAMRIAPGEGYWHKKNRSSIWPLRYWLEAAA